MKNMFNAFIFKLRKDMTFRITLFVGLGIAILMTLIYLAIDLGMSFLGESENPTFQHFFCTGENLLLTSLNPAQNFGIAIPINLISFTVLEFTQGTIRNKIITGNSKVKVYFGIYLSGLVFTLALISVYSLLCFGLGSAIGGFHPNGMTMGALLTGGNLTPQYIWMMIVLHLFAYITIATVTIFFATVIRHIGPCIPIIILLLFACYLSASLVGTVAAFGEADDPTDFFNILDGVMKVINPLYSLFAPKSELRTVGESTETFLVIPWDYFIAEVINNLVYIGIFLGFGLLIFKKRDIK